jgi:hypothetical protein
LVVDNYSTHQHFFVTFVDSIFGQAGAGFSTVNALVMANMFSRTSTRCVPFSFTRNIAWLLFDYTGLIGGVKTLDF